MSKRLLNYVIVLLVCLISSAESFAQGTKFQVKGNVTDASREPIVGATIKVKGTSQGVITNIDGEYSIDTRSNAILEFSYIGYVSQEVPVSGSKIINVTLQEEVSKLDEVVVVGYGTQKKNQCDRFCVQCLYQRNSQNSYSIIKQYFRRTNSGYCDSSGYRRTGI
ncbi:carboxypeptidase-like regulatory domain-containing protein [Bacteroides thetaiotaomicron]|uniref:carboxypeptidase-like regulatory domain-containing protein n=1 Tax=Bacteroides thetaiotaomicron TaxID=818 RepID=UPI0039C01E26